MAIASSSSEHVVHLNVPLHHQIVVASPRNVETMKSGIALESWEFTPAYYGVPAEACDSCPHCADRCSMENCPACAKKPLENVIPCSMFLSRADDEKYYTLCQIRRHDHAKSAWLLVGDTIYDATQYISKHPGGQMSILKKSGGKADCSVDFDFHSPGARRLWRKHRVGKLCPCRSHKSSFGKDEQCIIS
ncbi:cytochrome b5-like protein [Fragilaria crotonensis]|nr:cytochrome b5-like protein [Fragilaria crotonensis]